MSELRFKQPCRDCPFRRTALAGWLGGARPEWFTGIALSDTPGDNPCHLTIDYETPNWRETIEEDVISVCAGSLVFARNCGKLPRSYEHAEMAKSVDPDPEAVFTSPQEFIDYHNNALARSWE